MTKLIYIFQHLVVVISITYGVLESKIKDTGFNEQLFSF